MSLPEKKTHPALAILLGACAALTLLTSCDSTDTKKQTREERELLGDPADIEQMRDFARLYYDKSQYTKAAKQYQRIIGLEPKDPEATLALGMCYAQIGNQNVGYFDDGRKLLRTYNDELAGPDDARGYLALGVLHFKEASHTANTIDVALKRRIEFEDRIKELGDRSVTSDNRAERRRLEKESRAVASDLEKLSSRTIAELERSKADQLEASVRNLTDCIEVSKIDPLPYKLRAEANSLRGPDYYAMAVEDIDVYTELTVTSGRERFEKMLQTGETPDGDSVNSEAVLTTLNRLDRLESMLLEMRSSLLRRMGEPGQALADLERVLYLFPERSTPYAEIARCHEEMGNYSDAIKAWKQFEEHSPFNAIEARTEARIRVQDLEAQIGRSDRGVSRPYEEE